jgi:hypothetical protein
MKRCVVLLLCLALINVIFAPFIIAQTYSTDQPSRAIHIVYDDSGSMIKDDYGRYLDRWAQAKYAMEVFAAMLEENDTIRVYYMSDFDVKHGSKVNAPARIEITGSRNAQSRVDEVHKTITDAWNTPYDTVAKAYDELKKTNAVDKWLVVLTDGDFNQENGIPLEKEEDVKKLGEKVNGYFSQYINESGDVRIIILTMGDIIKTVFKEVPGRIFYEQAKNSEEILGKITSICNRIFNRNKLNFTNETRREFSFDIPMLELLVFAQGDKVEVKGISGDNIYRPNKPVNVRYSEVAAVNYRDDPNVIIPRSLTGVVAAFSDIKKGAYSLDISGAKTVEIYYKPVVNVDINLLKNGRKKKIQDIVEGDYQIQYGIVNEEGKFFESSLLGNVTYEATVQNNGQTTPIKSGDTVNLQQGDFKVRVQAHFLEINTAENTVTGRVQIPLPFKERLRNWIQHYWYIFWPLICLLLGLLLYWILWGRKKRFPRYMSSKPVIKIEKDGNIITKYGSFKINQKSKWLPFCPETGKIVAAADGKPLPSLKVKALGNGSMELTNTGDFMANKLSGADFYINDQPLPEGSAKNKRMSCTAQIKSIYYSAGSATTYICSFAKSGKKGKK